MRKSAAVVVCLVAGWTQTSNAQGPGISFPAGAVNVLANGAQADAQVSSPTGCTLAIDHVTLTCTAGLFLSSDVGKSIEVPLAGATQTSPAPPRATWLDKIASINTLDTTNGKYTKAVLQNGSMSNVTSNVPVTWGTDNSPLFQNAVNYCPPPTNPSIISPFTSKGCVIVVPNPGLAGTGDYMFGSTVTLPTQTSFQIKGMGNSSKWENSQEAGVRFLTAMSITILSIGQVQISQSGNPQSGNAGSFQLENISFVDTSNNGSAIGGLLMNVVSEAVIAYSSFENFNGQQAGLAANTTALSYGMKATAYGCVGNPGCSPLFNNNIVLLHVKGKNNSIFYDASQGQQDGPIVIGGDIFPTNNISSQPTNPPWNGTNYAGCFGIVSSGGIRLYGTHFDVGKDASGGGCVGVLTLSAGIISGKFESTPGGGTGVMLGGGGTTPNVTIPTGGCSKAASGAVTCGTGATNHGFSAGQVVNVNLPNTTDQPNFNGNFLITSVPTSTSFTYDYPGTAVAASVGGGIVNPKVSFSVKVEGIFNSLAKEVIINSGASNNTIHDMSSNVVTSHVTDNGTNDIVQLSYAGTGLNGATVGFNSATVNLGAATGSSDAIAVADATSNTGTGHLLSVIASSGSAAKPVEFAANGNGVEMSTSGVLAPIGSGGITANAMPVSSLTAATGADTIANGNNPLIWNWAQTTNSQTAMSFGETSAATGTSDVMVGISTASGSTATPLSISQGQLTGSTAIPALNVTGTWNNAAISPTGVIFNFTNTASGSSTNILALQIAGSNKFRVDKNGNSVANGYISSTGAATNITTKASNYTLTAQDGTVLCNGTITLTLPTTGIQTGQTYRIKFIASSGTCTISSSVNIDGATSFTITTQYNSVNVQWDGTQYWKVSANP